MGVVNPARPKAREVFFQGLGLSDAIKGLTKGILDQSVSPLQGILILTLPVGVVFPSGQGPSDLYWLIFNRHRQDLAAEPDPLGTARWSEPSVQR